MAKQLAIVLTFRVMIIGQIAVGQLPTSVEAWNWDVQRSGDNQVAPNLRRCAFYQKQAQPDDTRLARLTLLQALGPQGRLPTGKE
jgi:hypothetical protein